MWRGINYDSFATTNKCNIIFTRTISFYFAGWIVIKYGKANFFGKNITGYRNPHCHRNINANPNGHRFADPHRFADSNPNRNPFFNRDSHQDPHAHAIANTHAITHANRIPYPGSHTFVRLGSACFTCANFDVSLFIGGTIQFRYLSQRFICFASKV